jgi:hypothetical protein
MTFEEAVERLALCELKIRMLEKEVKLLTMGREELWKQLDRQIEFAGDCLKKLRKLGEIP